MSVNLPNITNNPSQTASGASSRALASGTASVSNIQKQIPKDRALQFALDDTILNDELKRWLSRSGMIDAV